MGIWKHSATTWKNC